METKVCIKCGEEKELTTEYWHRRKDSKDGFRNQCRECRGCKPKRRIKEGFKYCNKCNQEKELNENNWYKDIREASGFRSPCKECCKKQNVKYKKENKDKIQNYYEANYEHIQAYQKRYKEINKESLNKYNREYQKKYYLNPDNKLKAKKSKHDRRAKIDSLPNTLTNEEFKDNLDYFDNKCGYCGCELDDNNKMHLEHIVPVSKGGGFTKENIIPSCASCNLSKGASYLGHWYIRQSFYSLDNLVKVKNIMNNFKPWIIEA